MITFAEHQFFLVINEIFGSIIQDYGFEIYEENKNLVIARKGDIDLIFRLETVYLSHYFSLEIKLSGKLGKNATSDPSYRHLGVAAIAKCLDPNYTRPVKKANTEDDLREIAEGHKEELLKYCKSILLGDVSSWQKIVECLNSTRSNSL